MGLDLPPYNPAAKCAKCAYEVVTTHHYEVVFQPRMQLFASQGRLRFDEHMERKCARCGFRWAEAPLDAGVELVPPGSGTIESPPWLLEKP